jgi:hypothetical protein
MHILSELRNPQFDPPDRQRALRALQTSRLLKENNTTKAWSVVKSMIDKVMAEQFVTQTSPSNVYPRTSPQTAVLPIQNRVVPVYSNRVPSYTYQQTPEPYTLSSPQTVSQPQQQLPTSQPTSQPMQPSTPQFNWDEIDFSNIVGDIPQQNLEQPELDWVSVSSLLYICTFLTLPGFLG